MFLLSPRFIALPAIALAVIVSLAQAHGPKNDDQAIAGSVHAAAPAVYRAVNCSKPANAQHPQCAFAGQTGMTLTR
jgi:hypothetical protein